MKKRATSLFLALLLLVQLMGTAFAADAPLLISPAPNRTTEYVLREGDVIFVPGTAAAGETAQAYAVNCDGHKAGDPVSVTIPAGTSNADGSTVETGPKNNKSAGRFWVMEDGKLKRIVGVWEGTTAATAYKFGYHDFVTGLTDTGLTLANNEGHIGGGVCAYNFNGACGESGDKRWRECPSALAVAADMAIIDLRANVLAGTVKAVDTVQQVKSLCDAGTAVVNTYVPDGTVSGGTAAVMFVLDYEYTVVHKVIDVPVGSDVNLKPVVQTAVDLNGGGRLLLNNRAILHLLGAVTGKTELVFDGIPSENVVVTAPSATADDAFFYNGKVGKLTVTDNGTTKSWAVTDLPDVGLTFTIAEGGSVVLHDALPAQTLDVAGHPMEPTSVTTANGVTTVVYKHLAPGNYHYRAKMDGHYSYYQAVAYPQELCFTGKTIHVELPKRAGTNFEPEGVTLYTQDFIDKAMQSEPDTWGKEYEHIFISPWFLRDKSEKGFHQQTTQEEMEAFIAKLDDAQDNMYVFSLGKTPVYGFDVPLVLFTKENVAGKTLAQAAEIIRANGKPTIHYQAQVHGNEPAGGESALVMIGQMDAQYGESVLDSLDLYIIPRINPAGSYDFTREVPGTKANMNREYMSQNQDEIRMITGAYNLFRPHVVIDGHEQSQRTPYTEHTIADLAMKANGGALHNTAENTELTQHMAKLAMDAARQRGLRTEFYSNTAYSSNALQASAYYGIRASLGFLVESRGNYSGQNWMERRVISHYIPITTIINYTVDNAQQVMQTVADARQRNVTVGAIYEESDELVIKHGTVKDTTWLSPLMDMLTGEVIDANYETGYNRATQKVTVRPRPTAYLIPKSHPNADKIAELVVLHGAKYEEIPAGAAVKVQQYIMPKKAATLTGEQTVIFEAGAYVISAAQEDASILSMMFEPDMYNANASEGAQTLVEMKLVAADANGYLPIYRYIHDLVDGKITVEAECKGGESCPAAGFGDVDAAAWYHTAVDNVLTNGIMSGYNATAFGTNDSLTRAMVVQVLYNRMGKPEVKAENKFADVAEGAWYYDAVRWAANKKVVAGYSEDKFGSEDAVTIEQVAVILHNYDGKPAAESDLSAVGAYSDWAADALRWAESEGILKDVPLTDGVVATATRAQTAQMLYNYLNP